MPSDWSDWSDPSDHEGTHLCLYQKLGARHKYHIVYRTRGYLDYSRTRIELPSPGLAGRYTNALTREEVNLDRFWRQGTDAAVERRPSVFSSRSARTDWERSNNFELNETTALAPVREIEKRVCIR